MADDEKLVTVFAGSTAQADIVKGLLDEAGVRCYLDNENIGVMGPFIPAADCKVQVAAADEETAREAIAAARKQIPKE